MVCLAGRVKDYEESNSERGNAQCAAGAHHCVHDLSHLMQCSYRIDRFSHSSSVPSDKRRHTIKFSPIPICPALVS